MTNKTKDVKSVFEKDGFVILRNFLSEKEAKKIKRVANNWPDYINKPRCVSSFDGSDVIFNNQKLHSLITELVGSDPVYFGDGNITPNSDVYHVEEGDGMVHKDCIDRNDYSKPDWLSPYTGLRVGFYTNDHRNHSGGVTLIKGSHVRSIFPRHIFYRKPLIYVLDLFEIITGKAVYADVSPRDLVIWKLTTDHAGNARVLRWGKNRPITRFTNFLPKSFSKDSISGLRVALFVTFGADDNHLSRYIAGQKRRIQSVNSWLASDYTGTERNGRLKLFKLRDVGDELKKPSPDEIARMAKPNWEPQPADLE